LYIILNFTAIIQGINLSGYMDKATLGWNRNLRCIWFCSDRL